MVWMMAAPVISWFTCSSNVLRCLEQRPKLHMTASQGKGGAVLAREGLKQANGTLGFRHCSAKTGQSAAC